MTGRTSRAIGSLLGLAIGDALGAPLEFELRDSRTIRDFETGGLHDLPAGYWTDDTSMAICLAESLLAYQGFNARDQIQRYLAWWKFGMNSSTGKCFDIGEQTGNALEYHHKRLSDATYEGVIEQGILDASAGNGALIRLAPVAIFYTEIEDVLYFSQQNSLITHPNMESVHACMIAGWLIWHGLAGYDRDDVLGRMGKDLQSLLMDQTREPLSEKLMHILTRSYRSKTRDEINSSGYVVHTLEAALWALETTESFEEGMLLAVNLANDADTVGAVFGQIAGAFYGKDEIPKRWIQRVYQYGRIERLAEYLCTIAV